MKLIFDDAEFDGQLQRAVHKAYERSSDIGECLATAQRIRQGDLTTPVGSNKLLIHVQVQDPALRLHD